MILIVLLIAAFWGAAHALTPGHGKALVAGYLVGTKGTPRHAVLLGATVTVTHTVGVFALGLVTLVLSQFIVPDAALPVADARVRACSSFASARRPSLAAPHRRLGRSRPGTARTRTAFTITVITTTVTPSTTTTTITRTTIHDHAPSHDHAAPATTPSAHAACSASASRPASCRARRRSSSSCRRSPSIASASASR